MFSKIKNNLFFSLVFVLSTILFVGIAYFSSALDETRQQPFSIILSYELIFLLSSIYAFRKVFFSEKTTFQILISESSDIKHYATIELNVLIISAMFFSMGIMVRPTDTIYTQALSLQILELWIFSILFFFISGYLMFKKSIEIKAEDNILLKKEIA